MLENANTNMNLAKQCYSYPSNKTMSNIIGYIIRLVKSNETLKNIKIIRFITI